MPPAQAVTVTLDQKALDRAVARLKRYEGRDLQTRARKAYLEGARLLVTPMRREAPKGPTGNLRRSIAARAPKLRSGEMAVASVGPRGGRGKGAHRWFVTAGTQRHSLAPVRKGPWVRFPDGEVRRGADVTHPGSRANPFVDRVADRYGDQVRSFIAAQVVGFGVGVRDF